MRPHVIDFLDRFMPHSISVTIAPSWFTMVGLAGVVTLFVMMRVARRNGIDPGVIASAVLWCYVMAVAAGIVVPMMIDAVQQRVATGDVGLRWSGMTSFWGYLAGTGAVAIVCRDHGIPLARMGDMSTAPLGLALAFARIGCFLGGCDYGKVTSLPWAVRFPTGSPAWNDQVAAGLVPADRAMSLPVHPTQLYEALLGLAIAAIAIVIARRGLRQGRVFLVGAALYAFGRIGIEALRGDAGRGIYAGLSSGQIFSLIVLAAIGLGLLASRKRALHVVAAVAGIVLVADLHVAHAQVAPTAAQPAPAGMPGPAATMPAPNAVTAPPPIAQPPPSPPRLELGLLFGLATPLNRRGDQVAPLAGPSISIGYSFGIASAWLDVDSYGNKDASHGTLLFSGGIMQRSGQLSFGGRAGIGPTLVNFVDPVFRDVMGTTVRFEALAEYDFDRSSWALWVRPLTIDILSAADLGGPITTYQIRAGVAYRFGGHRAQPVYAYPYGQPYGQPYGPPPPYGQPPPQPQPQPQPQPAPTGAP